MVTYDTVHLINSHTFVKVENICRRGIFKMCIYGSHPIALWCILCCTYTLLVNIQHSKSPPLRGGVGRIP